MPSNINTSAIFRSSTKVYEYNFLMIYENIEKAVENFIFYMRCPIFYENVLRNVNSFGWKNF